MKPASLIAAFVFSLVAIAHLLRLVFEAEVLARNIHEGPTAAAHLRTLEREIDVRLLDVLPSTSPGPNADFSSQSTHLHALATDPHE